MQITHVFLEEKYRLHVLDTFWVFLVILGVKIALFQKILGVYFQKIIKNQPGGVILFRVAQSKAETRRFSMVYRFIYFFLDLHGHFDLESQKFSDFWHFPRAPVQVLNMQPVMQCTG